MLEVVAAVRPGVALREVGRTDEVVIVGGGEVFRLPLTPVALQRQSVLVRALPDLRRLVPVRVPHPRRVGVLPDGETPFTAEARLPGVRIAAMTGIAVAQREGVQAALDAVGPGQLREWGAVLVPRPAGWLADPRTGVLTGLVEWYETGPLPPAD